VLWITQIAAGHARYLEAHDAGDWGANVSSLGSASRRHGATLGRVWLNSDGPAPHSVRQSTQRTPRKQGTSVAAIGLAHHNWYRTAIKSAGRALLPASRQTPMLFFSPTPRNRPGGVSKALKSPSKLNKRDYEFPVSIARVSGAN